MNEIQVTARLKIHQGQQERFRQIAQVCLETVREKDNGTLQYDWFFNEDESECVVRERYQDSAAVMEHMGNLGETLGALLGLADLSLEVYGTPSEELASAIAGLDVTTYSYYQGL